MMCIRVSHIKTREHAVILSEAKDLAETGRSIQGDLRTEDPA